VARLAGKRPSPLLRGDLRIWAGATIHVVGSLNFLFDRTQRPHLTIGVFEPELCRREILESHPMAWMISVDGLIVDARTMPPEIQAEARRRGLIPDLPAAQPEDTE
jgi:hypothetical protein